LDFLIFEDGTDMLSRNVGKLLQTYAAQDPRRAKTSTAPRREPEMLQNTVCFLVFELESVT